MVRVWMGAWFAEKGGIRAGSQSAARVAPGKERGEFIERAAPTSNREIVERRSTHGEHGGFGFRGLPFGGDGFQLREGGEGGESLA